MTVTDEAAEARCACVNCDNNCCCVNCRKGCCWDCEPEDGGHCCCCPNAAPALAGGEAPVT